MNLRHYEMLIILDALEDKIENEMQEMNYTIYHMESLIKTFGEKVVKEDISRFKAKIKEMEENYGVDESPLDYEEFESWYEEYQQETERGLKGDL